MSSTTVDKRARSAVAKAASSSLKAAFAPLLGLDLAGAGGNLHELDFPAAPAADPAGSRLYPGLYTFGFVRNPDLHSRPFAGEHVKTHPLLADWHVFEATMR